MSNEAGSHLPSDLTKLVREADEIMQANDAEVDAIVVRLGAMESRARVQALAYAAKRLIELSNGEQDPSLKVSDAWLADRVADASERLLNAAIKPQTPKPAKPDAFRELRAAFKSWWSIVAIVVSAASIFNYVTRAMRLPLGDFMREFLSVYRGLFHPVIDFLFSPFHFTLVDWQKDLLVLWLAVGGATARTYNSEYMLSAEVARNSRSIQRHDPFATLLFTTTNVLIWPVAWMRLFIAPYFYAHMGREEVLFVDRTSSLPESKDYRLVADMRVVLLIQMLTVIVVVLVMTAVNAVGVQ